MHNQPQHLPSSYGKGSDDKATKQDLSRLESHAVGTVQLIEEAGTRRAIKSRHAQMIAIGGTTGTGLFVGSGQALSIGGPGFLFLAYTLTSLLSPAARWHIIPTASPLHHIIFLRFRKACAVQGVAVPYQSKFQPYGAYVCLCVFTVLLPCNGFTLFYPGKFTTSGFLTTYLGIPLFLALWLGHKIVKGRHDPWLISPHQVDLISGLVEVEADAEMWDCMEKIKKRSNQGDVWWKKLECLWT